MTLKDLLKKKDKIKNESVKDKPSEPAQDDVPQITFMRTTTMDQEIISPPSFPGDKTPPQRPQAGPRRHSRFRKGSNASTTASSADEAKAPKGERRLSERLHLGGRSRTPSSGSVNIPEDLPDIEAADAQGQEQEAQWEKRATLLAKRSPLSRSNSAANLDTEKDGMEGGTSSVGVSDDGGDENIQEAIRLHEAGDLERSTAMFGRLADPNGANNALSQVLYGLALRHGWGCTPSPELAITYLSYAASNSAEVESLALSAGMKKGGAAKGELVLAIFELANCFRHGWGVKRDPVAAKQYYETAANLGDTDAMNEVAWCYLEGFGCKKDKFKAARYLRFAEEKGSKTIGNTWIWKDKYGGPKKT